MAYLKMPPLVAISELYRHTLRQRLSYQRGLFPGEPLTLASRDDQHPVYGIEMGSGCATGRAAPTKGNPPAFVLSGAAELFPLPL